jgi:hypothetical protein
MILDAILLIYGITCSREYVGVKCLPFYLRELSVHFHMCVMIEKLSLHGLYHMIHTLACGFREDITSLNFLTSGQKGLANMVEIGGILP